MRNLSPNGARLVFAKPVTIPGRFALAIPQIADHRNVRIIWQSATEAGVVFEDARDADAVISLAAMRRIRRLEEERDLLARQLAEHAGPTQH